MKDRVVQYPGRYQLVPVDGTTDQFDLIAVPGTVSEAGTDLNKANLLTDAVATALGLTSSSVPNDILLAISARYGTCATAAATTAKVAALTNFTLSTGAVIGIKFTYSNSAATPTLDVNSTGAKSIYCNGAAISESMITAGQVCYFQYDGTYWQLLNPTGAQIASGSYTGTGTFGSANKKSLTFSFTPKVFVVMYLSNAGQRKLIGVNPSTALAPFHYTDTSPVNVISWGTTIQWYNTTSADFQANETSLVYYYYAIG